ncbi:helix-turn-helix transcriptional regulator [bacterium]|nr:helix-turn-helix transcriptional regulator [bacterium]
MIFDDKKYIAKKIKEYRLQNGLTQEELAEKIDIGTKQISRIEVGDFYPSLNTFLKIVEVLNINLNDFIAPNPKDDNKTRLKLINMIYNANNDEIDFYDRILTFATDEVAEVKKNILIKKTY